MTLSLRVGPTNNPDLIQRLNQLVVDMNAALITNASNLPPKVIADTSYSFVAEDVQHFLDFTAASAVTATLTGGVFNNGDIVNMRQSGNGKVTVTGGGGLTAHGSGGLVGTNGQYAVVGFYVNSATEATVFGDRA